MSDSKNVADMRKAASAAFGQKNYEEAIKIYSEALLMSSITKKEMALLHSSRSKAYLFSADNNSENSQTRIELALQDANAAIQIQPEWWIGYSQAGLVYRHQKEWVKALEQFKMALDRDETQDSVKKYQSECRFYKKRAEMRNNFMLHQLEGEIAATDHLYNSTFDVRDILEQYEILQLSDKPKVRLDSCAFFGVRYVKGINVPKDIPRGIKLLNEAVRGHSLQAMVELAILHIQGIGVEKDFKRAFNLLESVAIRDVYDDKSMGDYCIARAKFLIGLCYQDGTGKPQDYCKARGWYELARKTGHAGATNNLAVFCEQGLGGEKDSTRANDLFWISAKRGNPVAMESLAWKYLWEKDEQQAEGWFLKALEMGNPSSIKNKDQFCKLLQNLRVILEEVDSPLGAAFFNPVNPEKLIEVEDLGVRNDMLIVVRIESAANTVVTKYWKCYDEIKIRAANGFPFAQTLLTAMNSIAQCLNYYHHTSKAEHSPTIINFAKEQCIRCFANSLRATEVVGFLQPQTVTVIYQYCMDTVNARTEIAWKREASIVACYLLLATRSSNFRSFAERCLETYHDEPFLYQILAAHKALHGEYEGALKLYDDGLQLFPDDSCLRYRKADVLKCIGSSSDILNKAFKEYITIAPFDDRMIPEAYYTLALHSTAREGEFYNRIGKEAECNMLPCFLPYRSDTKVYVASLNENQDDKVKPGRLSTVLNHRRELKKMSQINRTGDASHATFGNTLQLSTRPDNFEEMTLQNMKPNEDMTYDHCFINLTICEDPIIDLLQSVRSVVVRDKNDDYMKCSLYNVDRHDQTVRENFIYGSKITIVNPHYHLPSDCSTSDPVPSSSSASNDVGFLKVDDPKLIIYRENGKDNLICRYCWRYYPELVCSKCKRSRYCCKDCQMSDWKILKHKLICGVKHLDG